MPRSTAKPMTESRKSIFLPQLSRSGSSSCFFSTRWVGVPSTRSSAAGPGVILVGIWTQDGGEGVVVDCVLAVVLVVVVVVVAVMGFG